MQNSALYRQSQIVGSVFSQQDVGALDIITDPAGRELLLRFAEALATAYVDFEFIPTNEIGAFAAIYESLGPNIEIESFAYRRRDLIITGSAPGRADYNEFLRSLQSHDHFGGVSGQFHQTEQGYIRFEIICEAA